jgi:hypothetical protein
LPLIWPGYATDPKESGIRTIVGNRGEVPALFSPRLKRSVAVAWLR